MVLPRMVVTGPGVLEQIPAIIAELDIPERGLIVCDSNTLDIAGNKVIEYLEAGGHPMEKVEIIGANIEELEKVEAFSDKIDFLVGLGGGRPIDIAKQAGFNNYFYTMTISGIHNSSYFFAEDSSFLVLQGTNINYHV